MNRRRFLRRTIGALAAVALPRLPGVRITPLVEPPPTAAGAQTPRTATAFAEALDGEDLWYEISILYFIKAAIGHVAFRKALYPGKFKATAEARAVGFIGWITDYRKVGFYTDLLVMDDGGKPRLAAVRFERNTTREDSEFRSVHRFDYGKRKWTVRVYADGKLTRARVEDIPPGVFYDDLTAAAYNFRLGVYGPPRKGMAFTVTTIPHLGVDRFDVKVCTDADEAQETSLKAKVPGAAYIVRVPIDQKIFGIQAGLAKFVADADLRPLAVAIQNAEHFGDVFAELVPKPQL